MSKNNLVWSCRCPAPDNLSAFHPPAHSRRPSPRCGSVRKSVCSQSAASSTHAGQRLPGQMHLMALRENLFLPIQRQMVAVFAHQNVRQQPRRGQTGLAGVPATARSPEPVQDQRGEHIFADGPAAQKTRRFIIQLLADFLPDATPGFGLLFHRFGINHFFDQGQVLGQARCALFPRTLTEALGSSRAVTPLFGP
jgi:hypothetical protein